MATASMIIQPASGYTDRLAGELAAINGVTVHTVTQNQQIIILVEAPTLEEVSLTGRTIENLTGVSGVYPAYVNEDD
jgi:nitrate reductase NapAB chaperone NapD